MSIQWRRLDIVLLLYTDDCFPFDIRLYTIPLHETRPVFRRVSRAPDNLSLRIPFHFHLDTHTLSFIWWIHFWNPRYVIYRHSSFPWRESDRKKTKKIRGAFVSVEFPLSDLMETLLYIINPRALDRYVTVGINSHQKNLQSEYNNPLLFRLDARRGSYSIVLNNIPTEEWMND